MNTLWSQYLAELPEHRKSTRSLRLSFQDLLMQPTCKTNTYGDRAFLRACIRSEHLERYVNAVQFYHLRKKKTQYLPFYYTLVFSQFTRLNTLQGTFANKILEDLYQFYVRLRCFRYNF